MKKTLLRTIKLIIAAAIIFSICSPIENKQVAADDQYDFENEFEYYKALRTTSPIAPENKEVCKAFLKYQQQKQEELAAEIADLKENIASLKADIKNQGKKITEYENQIANTEKQIASTERAIVKIQADIEELTVQIKEREDKIGELDSGIKARMVANQSKVSLNSYIRFVMGATSFIDLLRRISAVNEITSYDVSKIREMEAEKKQLEIDKVTLQEEKVNLENEEEMLKITKANLQQLKAAAQQLLEEYYRHEAELIEEMESAKDENSELEELLNDLDTILNGYHPSAGWSIFIKKAFRITSPCFYYTSGGFHPAVDAGAYSGTPVYAIANGYVVASKQGCGYGYLGNSCNGGRGNFVDYIVQVGTGIYWVCNYHMTNQKVVSVGDFIYGGQTVTGYVWSSGSSTGPHLHIGIIYLGDTTSGYSIQKGAQDYYRKGNRFGLPFNYSGSCPARNNKAPCYANIQEILDVWYPRLYNANN
ncbi:MAG: peptidoglycan DD-metalloendopeptidase family protein [Erysipelotrichaceae bacterium]|nr:peptidoglycan DD-metalloendopeptidase family protein [Erysipelotrichaceae bacterium]